MATPTEEVKTNLNFRRYEEGNTEWGDWSEKIFAQEGQILVFADFAGRIAPLLSELNRKRNLTLILDHHVARPSSDPFIHNLDPELFGIKGDRDMTASTTCYFFARTMDSSNRDLAHIAVVGAVGDGFFINNRLISHNRDPVLEAVGQGRLEIRNHGNGEQYVLNSPDGQVPCDKLSAYLDTLGAAGYYRKGPEMGIRVCLGGFSDACHSLAAATTVMIGKEEELIEYGSITREALNLLKVAIKGKLNIIISGGTGTGKTTMLNLLSSYIPEDERIVTIEDTAELQMRQNHIVRLETRPPNIEGKGEIDQRAL